MIKKRIDAKTIRHLAEVVRTEAEVRAAEDLRHIRRTKKIIGAIASNALQAACEGKQCVRLDANLHQDHISLLISNGFSVVDVGYVREKDLGLHEVAQGHKSAIEKLIIDTVELQDFLWANQLPGSAAATNIGILFKLLDKTHSAWAKDGYPRSRVYFKDFLVGKKHFINGTGLAPARVIFESLESVWLEFVWYKSALADAKIFNADLRAVTKGATDSEIYAVWHDAIATAESFTEPMPSAGFLKWISETDGQNLLNGIDEKLRESAELGQTETNVSLSKRGKNIYWLIGNAAYPGPSPAVFSKIISFRGLKVRIKSESDVIIYC